MSSKPSQKAGKLLIVTAPSGAGKTTIVQHLLEQFDELAFSVSATTRPPRPGEEHGVDYYFLSQEAFKAAVAADEFVEWEEVYPGRCYGTLKAEINRLWAANKTVVFDVEVVGATNLKKFYPEDSLSVFVQPPSPEILFERLRNRNTENEESLRVRIARATEELAYAENFDTVLVNDDLALALAEARGMVKAMIVL